MSRLPWPYEESTIKLLAYVLTLGIVVLTIIALGASRPRTLNELSPFPLLHTLHACVGCVLLWAIVSVYSSQDIQAYIPRPGGWLTQLRRLRDRWLIQLRRLVVLGVLIWRITDRWMWIRIVFLAPCALATSLANYFKLQKTGILIDMLFQWSEKGQWIEVAYFLILYLLVSEAGIPFLQNALWLPVDHHWGSVLKKKGMSHAMSLCARYHDTHPPSDTYITVTQIENVAQIIHTIYVDTLPMVANLLVTYIYLTTLLGQRLYWNFIIATIVIYSGISFRSLASVGEQTRCARQRHTETIEVAHVNVFSRHIIATLGRADDETTRYSNAVDAEASAKIKATNRRRLYNLAQQLTLHLGLAASIFRVIYRIGKNESSPGELVGLLTNWSNLVSPVQNFYFSATGAVQTVTVLEPFIDILNTKPTVEDKEGAQPLRQGEGKLELRNIDFSYDGKSQVLRGISLSVRPKQFIALVGPSGSGKSSLASLLWRHYDVTAGEILIDGQDIRDITQDSLRKSIALVPQWRDFPGVTILDVVRYPRPSASEEEVEEACKAAIIHEQIKRLPKGYKTLWKEVKFSDGERQRIAIARCLTDRDARVVVLDEATSSLDQDTEYEVWKAICRINRTKIVIAHRLTIVRNADVIYVLSEGKIIENGTHAELLCIENGKYMSMLSKQNPE